MALRKVTFFTLLGLFLFNIGACPPAWERCQGHEDCDGTQRCDSSTARCVALCKSSKECGATHRCDLKEEVCLPIRCPKGGVAKHGVCPCKTLADCPEFTYCDATLGACRWLCMPGRKGPQEDDCVCPPEWEWVKHECRAKCYVGFQRRADGICHPTLALLGAAWEQTPKGRFRLHCPQGIVRAKDGNCRFIPTDGSGTPSQPPPRPGNPNTSVLPWDPEALRKKVGPQKPCPTDGQTWDEGYLQRMKLPPTTSILYVDATATAGGEGTKASPFPSIQEAVARATIGSVVLVAPGVYPWGITLDKALHLVGLCPAKVRLQANAQSTGSGIYSTSGDLFLEGLSLRGNAHVAYGIEVHQRDSQMTVVRQVHVQNASEVGLFIQKGRGLVEHSRVEGTSIGKNGQYGYGVVVRETKKVKVGQNQIHTNASVGLLLSGAEEAEVLQNLFYENGTQDQGGRGIEVQKTKKVKVHQNQIHTNASHGLHLSRVEEAEVVQNLVDENGTQDKDGRGINIQYTKKVKVGQNQIHTNAFTGLHLIRVEEAEVLQNLVYENGTQHKDGVGIAIEETKKIKVGQNQMHTNAFTGLSLFGVEEAEVVQNLVYENGTQDKEGRGIEIQGTKKIKVGQNQMHTNASYGLLLSRGEEVEVVQNLVYENGTQDKESRGIGIRDTKKVKVGRNQMHTNAGVGLLLSQVEEGEVLQNLFYENGTKDKEGIGLVVQDAKKVKVGQNQIHTNAGVGLLLNQVKEGEVLQNLIYQNGTPKKGFGIGVQDTKKVTFVRNAFSTQNIGVSIMRTPEEGKVELRQNIWHHHLRIGLLLEENQASVSVAQNTFLQNNGRHMLIRNHPGVVTIRGNAFQHARAAPPLSSRGISSSAGTAIGIEAKGLVRWVFAEADFPCSPTQKGLVPRLANGLTMRPIRTPRDLDPCKKWFFETRYRTEEARRRASICQTCYGQGMGCRWVWQDVGIGASKKLGLWTPLEKHPTCVPLAPTSLDTCVQSFGSPVFPSISSLRIVLGQCIHPKKEGKDPCEAPRMRECKEREKDEQSYCFRQKPTIEGLIEASCIFWKNAVNVCRPDALRESPCPLETLCLSSMAVVIPSDATPSNVTLARNVFWQNHGPDVLMDMAGKISLHQNLYLSCVPSASHPECKPKAGVQSCVPGKEANCPPSQEKPHRGYRQVMLPEGATMVWQNPSPFDTPYGSRLEGVDLLRTHGGFALLFRPTTCQQLAR